MKASTPVKPYTSKELARLYGISRRTFHKWIEPHLAKIGGKIGRFFTVAQVQTIFECIGLPPNTE